MSLVLPRGYISWSQFDLWRRNKNGYRNSYYHQKGFSGNKYTAYGTEVHKMIESGNHPFANMPDFEVSEKEIKVELDGFEILSYIDGFNPDTHTVFELKTGKRPWTQKRVDTHDQLIFYAMAVHEAYGAHDPSVTLVWLETHDVPCPEIIDGIEWETTKPEITGQIQIFKRNIGNLEIAKFRKDVIKVANEIHKDYEEFRNSLILD